MSDAANESQAKELEKQWWQNWHMADYSWEGLKTHKIPNGHICGATNLQDYWRYKPDGSGGSSRRDDMEMKKGGELVTISGIDWHISFFPIIDPRGNFSGKSLNNAQMELREAIIKERIEYGRASTDDKEGRAILTGTIIDFSLPVTTQSAQHIKADYSALTGGTNLFKTEFADLDLSHSLLTGLTLTFHDIKFLNSVRV